MTEQDQIKASDGGNAFPFPSTYFERSDGVMVNDFGSPGMSLRAYFAGQALPAVIDGQINLIAAGKASVEGSCERVAEICVNFADALNARLAKQ